MILQNINEIYLSSVIAKCNTNSKKVVITYDCGEESEGATSSILAVLERHNVKATFFLTGKWIEKYSSLANRIVEENHEIGNHSYSHPDFTKITEAEMVEEITKAEETIKKIIGVDPKPIIRLPYGSVNTKALRVVRALGYQNTIQWSIDPREWELPPSSIIVNSVLNNISNGDIILLHNHGVNTAVASDIFIPRLKKQEYEFLTVGGLI